MKFDRKDIEAIAKSRTNRAEGNKLTYYTIALGAGILGGAYLVRINTVIGFIVAFLGVAVFYWYVNQLNKRIAITKHLLMKEWESENK